MPPTPDPDINLPGFGKVPRKYAIGGVVVGGGVAILVFIRARASAKAAAQQAAQTTNQTALAGMVTDPAGNQCSALDPNSGYCPGTPEDQAYQEEQASTAYGDYGLGFSGGGGGTSVSGYVTDPAGNMCVSVDSSTGYCPGTPQDVAAGGTSGTGTATPATNSQWLIQALAVLPGGNTSANATALTDVIDGVPVTVAQQQVFLTAVGVVGYPPQGYPTIHLTDTSGQPSTTNPTTSGKAAGAITGLTGVGIANGIRVSWRPAVGASQGYQYTIRNLANHTTVKSNVRTSATSVTVSGLVKGTDYNFGIQGLPGGPGANIHVKAA